jgi:iron-sulfur cluster insertion protein
MSVTVTENAIKKLKSLKAEEGNDALKLRVYITGGGCSGFSYGFTFDEVIKDNDTQIARDGELVLIDALSIQYLAGAEVDYSEGLQGSRFTVHNPSATSTCGCGSSFSI